jgi:hypothetical protein
VLEQAWPHIVKLLAFWEAASVPFPSVPFPSATLAKAPAKMATNAILIENGEPFKKGDKWAFLGDWVTPHGSERSDTAEALLFNNMYVPLHHSCSVLCCAVYSSCLCSSSTAFAAFSSYVGTFSTATVLQLPPHVCSARRKTPVSTMTT